MPFGALADYATVTADGKLTMVGCFDQMFLPEAALGQKLQALAYLVARLEGSVGDGSNGEFELRLLDEDEKSQSVKKLDGFTLGWRGSGQSLATQLVIAITGMPVPSSYGTYHFAFFVNGQRVAGEVSLHLQPRSAESQK